MRTLKKPQPEVSVIDCCEKELDALSHVVINALEDNLNLMKLFLKKKSSDSNEEVNIKLALKEVLLGKAERQMLVLLDLETMMVIPETVVLKVLKDE